MGAVRLEPFSEAHLEGFSTMIEDADVKRFTFVPTSIPADFPRSWLDGYERGRSDGTREAFALEDEHGAFLGIGVAFRIDRAARSVELGYVVTPEARGRGVATEALRLLAEWAFRELDVMRIELRIATDNEGSKRVAERAGFVREGVLRSLHFKEDIRVDTEIWSRLSTGR